MISPEKYLDFLACLEELIGTLLEVSLSARTKEEN